jgi:integrase
VSSAAYEGDRVLTQKQVKAMVAARRKFRDKLVIAFLAQTGQRLGVMTAMKYPMIRKIDGRGLVEVPPTLLNPHGENVNKAEVRYKFIIGRDAMRLIEKVSDKSGWMLELSERQIGRVVDESATSIGVQEPTPTKIEGRSWHFVHPHVFRKYWKRQMKLGKIEDRDLLNFMMGHKLAYGGAYDKFEDEDLLRAYKKAERQLEIF